MEYEAKTILQDGIRKGKAEGKAEGKVEGKIEGKVDSILELLEDLGEVPDELRLHIQKEKNLDVLTVYLKKVSRVQSVEEFEQWIRQEGK